MSTTTDSDALFTDTGTNAGTGARTNTGTGTNTLELKGIVKNYKGSTVLDDINLAVPAASTLVLFGPSGGGKSVLLRLIAGVIEPDKGAILICLLYTSPSPRDQRGSRMPSSA